MTNQQTSRFRTVGDGSGVEREGRYFQEEVALALRNRGIPLEGLRYPITPTGMHYLLVHWDVPEVDAGSWRLQIGGLVERPLTLSLDDVQRRPRVTMPVTMECAGNGRAWMHPRPISQPWLGEAVSTAEWAGTPLRPLLEEAGLQSGTVDIVFTGADRGVQGEELHYYQRALSPADAIRDEVMLAYEMNGRPLEPQHGYPLRLLVPGWYGMTSVKWLTSIEAIGREFDGFQQATAYRYTDDPDDFGTPVTTINARAMMVPPGVPDFLTRTRLVEAGLVQLSGRAWAGRRTVTRVELSADGGATWTNATLGEQVGEFAWRGWRCEWNATPGRYKLTVRATDSDGNVQPAEAWNLQGMGNNMSQRVDVIVEEKLG